MDRQGPEDLKLRHDLIQVVWDDAGEVGAGWVQDHEIQPKAMIAISVGFLIAKTKTHLVIASTVGEHQANTAQFQIPRKMVKTIYTLFKKGSELESSR
jgi:hypothetical protein